MTDPLRPLGKTPPRASPLQPDRPGGGELPHDDDAKAHSAEELTKAEEQSSTATSNVRDGYK